MLVQLPDIVVFHRCHLFLHGLEPTIFLWSTQHVIECSRFRYIGSGILSIHLHSSQEITNLSLTVGHLAVQGLVIRCLISNHWLRAYTLVLEFQFHIVVSSGCDIQLSATVALVERYISTETDPPLVRIIEPASLRLLSIYTYTRMHFLALLSSFPCSSLGTCA